MSNDEAAEVLACNDCGVDVVAAGEYYMLRSDIWKEQLGLGWSDNLCIGCLEQRLGRTVTLRDFGSFPSYPWMQPASDRLMDRFGFKKKTQRKASR